MATGRTLSARPRSTPEPAEEATPAPVPASPAIKGQNLQDAFLNLLRKNKTPVTMFLVKGVKLQGIVTWFDNFSILLRRDGQSQLVYKHAISTIMPSHPLDAGMFGSIGEGSRNAVVMVEEITAAIREQGSATNSIANQVDRMAHMAEESSAAAGLSAEAAKQLDQLAADMQRIVSRYKL